MVVEDYRIEAAKLRKLRRAGNIFKRRDYEPWERPTPYIPGVHRNIDIYGAYINQMHESGNYSMSLVAFMWGYSIVDVSGKPGESQKVTIEYFTGKYTRVEPDYNAGWGAYTAVKRETATYEYTVPASVPSGDAQGGGGNSSYNEVPGWVDKANTGVGAFMVGNNAKEQLISYASRTGDIGKAGVRYLKVVRSTGVAGSLFGMGVSGYNIYNDYSQGGIDAVNGWDVADFGVGAAGLGATIFLVSNPVGWVISGGVAIYFTVRLIHDAATDD